MARLIGQTAEDYLPPPQDQHDAPAPSGEWLDESPAPDGAHESLAALLDRHAAILDADARSYGWADATQRADAQTWLAREAAAHLDRMTALLGDAAPARLPSHLWLAGALWARLGSDPAWSAGVIPPRVRLAGGLYQLVQQAAERAWGQWTAARAATDGTAQDGETGVAA